MSAPTNYSIPIETWVQVTTNATIVTLYNKDINYTYYQTYVDTGEAAPAAFTDGVVPAIAVKMFDKGNNRELMLSAAGVDVYVTSFRNGYETGSGTVRVDS